MELPVFVPTLIATVLTSIGGPLLRMPDPPPAVSAHISVNDNTFGGMQEMALLGAGVFGALAVASAIWLHRRVTPDLLTPENAAGDEGQPGGAPSS